MGKLWIVEINHLEVSKEGLLLKAQRESKPKRLRRFQKFLMPFR